jgi:hypothetical protein
VVGQFYVAVVVALFVGMYSQQPRILLGTKPRFEPVMNRDRQTMAPISHFAVRNQLQF